MRRLGAVGLGLAGLFIALVAWRATRLFGQARVEIARALTEASGAHASVGATAFAFEHWSLVARDITLDDHGRRWLSARELRARPDFSAWLRGRFALRSVMLTGVRLNVDASDLTRLSRMIRKGHDSFAALRMQDAQFTLVSLAVGKLELAHVNFELSRAGERARFRLNAQQASLQRGDRSATAAGLGLQGELSERAGQLAGRGQLRLERSHLFDRALSAPLELGWQISGSRVGCEGVLAFGQSGALGVTLALAFADPATEPALELQLRPAGLQLEAALAQLGLRAAQLTGVLDGSISLHGRLQPLALQGAVELDVHNLRAGDATAIVAVPQLHTAAQLRFDAAGLLLSALRVALPSAQLVGQAQLAPGHQLSAELSAPNLDLIDVGQLGGVSVVGRGSVALRLQGSLGEPELSTTLALTDAAVGGAQLGKLNAVLQLTEQGRLLRIEQAQISSPERSLSTSGASLRFAAGLAEARAHVQVLRLPLAELYRMLGAADDSVLSRLQGNTLGSAELAYQRAAGDGKLELGLSLRLADISLAGYGFDHGQLQARVAIPVGAAGLSAGALSLQQLRLAAGDGTLDIAGEMKRGVLGIKVALHKLPVQRVPWLQAHAGLLTGRMDGSGSFGGDKKARRGDFLLVLDQLQLLGRPLGRIELHSQLRRSGDSVDNAGSCPAGSDALAKAADSTWLICGAGLDQRMHVDLALGNDEGRATRGRIELSEFSLAPFLPEANGGGRVPGTLSAALDITDGGLADPEHVSGRLRVTKLVLGEGDGSLASSSAFELRSQAGALDLQRGSLRGRNQKFTLSAAGSLAHAGRLIADGTVAAGLFTRAGEPLVHAFGDVAVHLEWSPALTPALRGRADMSEVVVQVGEGSAVRKLQGAFAIADDQVQIDGVTAEFGGGRLKLAGEFTLAGLRVSSYQLALHAERVSLVPQPLVELELDADTHLGWAGGTATPQLSGGVKLKRLLYGKQLHLDVIAGRNRAQEARSERDQLLLDLTVEHEQPLRVRNSSLDGELAIAGPDHKLRILGSDRQLGLLGQLSVTRGRLSFQGDEYHITRGDIAFRDARRIAPTFEVRAVADRPKRPDTSIVLAARGTRDAYNIEVHCDARSASVEPPPFRCEYKSEKMRCDSFEQLIATYVCRTKATVSLGSSQQRSSVATQ